MKAVHVLTTLCFIVSCVAEPEVTEYCEEQCKNVCIPCNDPVRCTDEQRDCGLGDPDPAFGGVCPAHSICVPKDFNCKIFVFYNILQIPFRIA